MTREYYNLLDIRALRIRGREIGVKAPTMYNKSDLIEQIIAIENGIVKPVQAEQRTKGRPPMGCNLTLQGVEVEMAEDSVRRQAIKEEPIKEDNARQEAVEPNYEQARKEQNNYRQPPRYQPQCNPRNYEFVFQRIRAIQDMLEEIFDYLIYESF